MEKTILFQTLHGSRLYGLSHADSDYDYYTVVDKVKTAKAKYATHSVVGNRDSVVVDFGTWVDQCALGVPQALEAMFSDMAEVDLIEQYRKGFKVGTEVYDRYLRTIKSFAYSEKDSAKRKRHALRLALNLRSIRGTGRFNPTLSETQAASMTRLANKWDADEIYRAAMTMAWG